MIDIHSHIIFGVDDGSVDMEQTYNMLREAKEAGVRAIFATPHFVDYMLEPEKVMANFAKTEELGEKNGIRMFTGYEVNLLPMLVNKTELLRKHTYFNTRYILCEFPFGATKYSEKTSLELLDNIQYSMLKPIIAHPERTDIFVKHRKNIKKLKEKGCLFQVNAGSIIGVYGEKVKTVARKLIDEEVADFVASDAHKLGQYAHFAKAYEKVALLKGNGYADNIFMLNQNRLLMQNNIF